MTRATLAVVGVVAMLATGCGSDGPSAEASLASKVAANASEVLAAGTSVESCEQSAHAPDDAVGRGRYFTCSITTGLGTCCETESSIETSCDVDADGNVTCGVWRPS